MPKWWDDGRAYYAPNRWDLNTNIIWIAAIAPAAVVVPVLLVVQWLFCRG